MVPHCKNICKDPRVNMLALEDGLVPESENFMLGRVRRVFDYQCSADLMARTRQATIGDKDSATT